MYDLAIIGGGPAGYVAAERAGHQGLSVLLFEKASLGGVCLNEGCIPTKTLLYSAKTYENAVHGDKYGVKASEVGFDFGKMMARKNKVVRKLVAGVEAQMRAGKVTVIKEAAYIKGRSDQGIELTTISQATAAGQADSGKKAGQEAGESYFVANLLICTGSEAMVPPIPGLAEAGEILLTNREILQLKEQPAELVVIGGGVIGMEFASFFNSLGSKVTVIEMLPEILGGLDLEISALLRDIYAKKGINFHLQAKVVKVKGNEVLFEQEGKTHSVKGDKILLSVGRRAVTKGFGLENLGVELLRNGIKVDEKMRTNIPGVFAAGDVTGFSLLAHTASREGEVVVNNILAARQAAQSGSKARYDRMRYDAIPGVVYTNPEVAGTGLSEEAARAAGIEFKISKLPMAYAGRFVAENEGGSGLCKIISDSRNGRVLGVHMLGNPCSEIIWGACLAIEQEMSLEELRQVVFPHPTVSEIIKETAYTA